MLVQEFSLEEFKVISKDVHYYAFKEIREPDENTFDFALVSLKDNKPMAYATCINMDKFTCYMQHGGALPDAKGTINVALGYAAMIKFLSKKYKTITTRIEHKNVPMQKLALSVGFLIYGVDYFDDEIFLHLKKTNQEVM
jgi:hypothetical protein